MYTHTHIYIPMYIELGYIDRLIDELFTNIIVQSYHRQQIITNTYNISHLAWLERNV